MTTRALIERVRTSLFLIPSLFIAAAGALVWVTVRLDRAGIADEAVFLLPTSVDGARSVLGTIAGATITVAALVFSLTAVTVQLAASQYSPRLMSEFLGDRPQQVVVGVVVGTFTYSLGALATIGGGVGDPSGVTAAWAATVATLLAVATIVSIVLFIDRVTTRISVDDTVRRIADATRRQFESLLGGRSGVGGLDAGWANDPSATSYVIPVPATGWVQDIEVSRLVSVAAPGEQVRIDAGIGQHVVEGEPLMTVWTSTEQHDADHIRRLQDTVEIGTMRTIAADAGFGLRQLVDIALRALSPGVNDPTTAVDVVHQLVEPLRVVVVHGVAARVVHGEDGRLVALAHEPTRRDHIRTAFSEIRLAATGQPQVAAALAESLLVLRRFARDADAVNALDEQLELLVEAVDGWELPAPDLEAVRKVFASYRRVGEESVAT